MIPVEVHELRGPQPPQPPPRLTVDLHSRPSQTRQSHPSVTLTEASTGSPISLASRLWQTDGSQNLS